MSEDSVGFESGIDPKTLAVVSIDYGHKEIHNQKAFKIKEGIVLNNATKEYLITTPAGDSKAHMVIKIDGAQDTSYRLARGTGKTGGTAVPSYNLDDNNTEDAAGTIVTHTPAGAEGGSAVVLETARWGVPAAGGGRGAVSGESGGRVERILRAGTKYSLQVTALSANNNNITVEFQWYEHTNVN